MPALFCLFLVFSNKKYNSYNKSMWKNVIECQDSNHDLLNMSHHP